MKHGSAERANGRASGITKPTCSARCRVRDNVARGSNLMTDEWKAYKTVAILEDHNHSTVTHSKNQWRHGNTHTNTIEGFWSQLKRSIDGTYHVVSPKYLSSYLSEFQFRYNHGRTSDEHLF